MRSPFPSPFVRIAATILDFVFLLAVISVGKSIDTLFGFTEDTPYISAVLFLILSGYQLVILIKEGQTLGKKAFRIKIVKWSDGSNGGFIHNVLLRRIIGIFDLTLIVPQADFITMLAHGHRRALHDVIAGTVVMNEEHCRQFESAADEIHEPKKTSIPAIISGVVGFHVILFLFIAIPMILAVSDRAHPKMKQFTSPVFSIDYPKGYSVDTTGSDSAVGVAQFSRDEGAMVQIEYVNGPEAQLYTDKRQFVAFEVLMSTEVDSLNVNDTLTGYGSFEGSGRQYVLYSNGFTMTAKVFILRDEGRFCSIVEIYSDLFSRRTVQDFKRMEESFSFVPKGSGDTTKLSAR